MPSRAVVDSGSPYSIASSRHANRINIQARPNTAIDVVTVNGPGKSTGRQHASTTIGSLTKSIDYHIFPHFEHDILIGSQDAATFKLIVDFANESITQTQASAQPKSVLHVDPIRTKDELIASLDARSVFAENDKDVGRIRLAKHHIRLRSDQVPIHSRPYRISETKIALWRKHCAELQAKGLIRPSKSPWSFPCTLAPKKDGSTRPVMDYRKLNSVTIDERFPLPLIKDLVDRVARASIYTILDLAWGFWSVPLDEDSIEKTAFVTPFGQFEWLVMPMGLKNAPATFQRIMQLVLDEFEGVATYLDDIVIFNDN